MNLLNNRSLLNSGLSLIVMVASVCGCTELQQSPEINNQSIKSTKALNEADVRYNLALSDFEKSLNEAFSTHESNIQTASKDSAAELSSLNSCLKIVSFMAWDKVRSKNKTETYLQEKITPSLELANKALPQALDKAISTFEDKKNKNTEQLKSDISSILMQPVQDSFNSNSNLSSKLKQIKR